MRKEAELALKLRSQGLISSSEELMLFEAACAMADNRKMINPKKRRRFIKKAFTILKRVAEEKKNSLVEAENN